MGHGGARPNSGPKPSIAKLTERLTEKAYTIAEAKFWVDLAENKAVKRMEEILDSPIQKVGAKAIISVAKEVLDRALGKPKESVDVTSGGKALKYVSDVEVSQRISKLKK